MTTRFTPCAVYAPSTKTVVFQRASIPHATPIPSESLGPSLMRTEPQTKVRALPALQPGADMAQFCRGFMPV